MRFAEWSYEFDEDGGYDATSAAFRIVHDNGGRRWVPLRVDVAAWVIMPSADEDERYRKLHERRPDTEEFAAFLVAMLNAHGS